MPCKQAANMGCHIQGKSLHDPKITVCPNIVQGYDSHSGTEAFYNPPQVEPQAASQLDLLLRPFNPWKNSLKTTG
jgi:hypothetical protein